MEWSPIVDPAVARHHRELVTQWVDANIAGVDGLDAVHLAMLLLYADLDGDHDVAALVSRGVGEALSEPGRFGAFVGPFAAAWALAVLQTSAWSGIEADDLLVELDDAAQACVRGARAMSYGLRAGAAAPGGYLLERAEGSRDARWAPALLDRLEVCAVPRPEGIALYTDPHWLSPLVGIEHPRGRYDLGMADGAAGAVALLCGLVERGIERSRASELLEGVCSWLVAQVERHGGVPAWVSLDDRPGPIGLGWCSGAVGVAMSMHRAGRALARPEWCDWAIDQAERWTLGSALGAREPEASAAGCLCHGSAGVVYGLARLHGASGRRSLRAAAQAWIDARLVPHFVGEPRGARAGATLLGRLGGALVLSSMGSERPPSWSRLLLC